MRAPLSSGTRARQRPEPIAAVTSDVTPPTNDAQDRLVAFALTSGAALLAAAAPHLSARLGKKLRPALAEPIASLVLTGAGWAAIAGTERLRPFRQSWAVSHDDVPADLAYLLITTPLTGFLATELSDAICRRVRPERAASTRRGIGNWSSASQVVVGTTITELVHYAHHRAAHEIPLLWRFHSVHHTVDRLYWLNSLRFHPLDILPLIVLQLVPMKLAGIDADALARVQVFKSIHGQLQHSNIRASGGRLGWVFSTLDQHRLHHSSDLSSRRSNFGAVLSVFDLLLGTLERPHDRPFDGEVGTGADTTGSRRFRDQMIGPFGQGNIGL